MIKEERNMETNETEETPPQPKEYTSPKLTHYGGISDLVQNMVGMGTDGATDVATLS